MTARADKPKETTIGAGRRRLSRGAVFVGLLGLVFLLVSHDLVDPGQAALSSSSHSTASTGTVIDWVVANA
jgi:hypothetical protein